MNILGRNFHSKKLRTGTHKSNRFVITLRDIQGEHADIEKRIEAIQKEGVPNYFGIQRRQETASNLQAASTVCVEVPDFLISNIFIFIKPNVL